MPASRLTIIFILAVVLSGSALTWFSINNISNLKELTEKRILEEQRELYSRFSEAIQTKINNVASGINEETRLSGNLKDLLIKKESENVFIIQPFILKNEGWFLYPYFTGIPEEQSVVRYSERFIYAFSAGEKAEFTEKNFPQAKDYYLKCLGYSAGTSDSVRALNALGRISVKLKTIDDAINYYYPITSDYFQLTDENGISYVNYALPQLLKISGSDNQAKILTTVESSLVNMESGIVPLNYNTEELLDLVLAWIIDNAINEKSDHLKDLINRIRRQSQFVTKYGNQLAELVKERNPDNHAVTGNDFQAVYTITGNNHEFFLLNTNLDNPVGFLIDRKKLLDTVLTTDLQSDLGFEYKIEFPEKNNSKSTGRSLVFTSLLTPWFPDQELEIKLTNEYLIKELVTRRTWIYGFASVLLLVAMCLGVVLILRDIGRERNLARLRADFISNVTHELKTPLTSIRMYAESLIMERVRSDSEQKEYLSVVVTETDRLKRMINNILEFSKMEKGKSEYRFVSSNLASILNASIQEMNYWFEKEKFEVVTDLDEKINAEVDPEKMKQAISNLLSNAVKYSADIKKISVRLYKKQNHICIEVEDQGIGIAEDKLSKIFEEFYRIEQKEGISGTGLGLTVAREIIEGHNGTISVTSEIRKGSRFTISLPSGGI